MGVIGLQWARMLARRIGTLWLAPVVFLMTGGALAQDAAPASGPGFWNRCCWLVLWRSSTL